MTILRLEASHRQIYATRRKVGTRKPSLLGLVYGKTPVLYALHVSRLHVEVLICLSRIH